MTANQGPANYWPIIRGLLIALGIPLAAGLTFIDLVAHNPLLAVIITLVYELFIFVIGLVSETGQELRKRWVGRVADWVDLEILSLVSGYQKRYREALVYAHRYFDVKGLTTQNIYALELEHVFVELTVAPQTPHRIAVDPLQQVPEELRQGSHPIWDYLKAEPIGDQSFVILGPPGSGKTTLLKHTTLLLAAEKKRRHQANVPDKIPILIFLREHAQAIKENPNFLLPEAVQAALSKWASRYQPPPRWFESQLIRRRCLVMLDGLDEIADLETRKQVVAWIEQQIDTYAGNRFIITSRRFGYLTNPLGGVTVFEVRPFTDLQVEKFVHNWYLANEIMSAQKDDPGVRIDAQQGAEDLLRRIHSATALADMAVNPLLLTMIANVHRYRSSLPGRRVELYAEICEVFLGKRQAARGIEQDLTPAQKRRVLQALAYYMMDQQLREIPLADALETIAPSLKRVSQQSDGQEFLKMIENSSGLLLERASGFYSFAHLTFQEYLAAIHIQENHLTAKLINHVNDSWWHEAIHLYVAQADATPIITACLDEEPPSTLALLLAAECAEEAREVQPEIREKLEKALGHGMEDADPERQRIVADVLLSLRLRRMNRINQDTYIDVSPITQAEYQLFLDEREVEGRYYQPDHWQQKRFLPGEGRQPVVGVRPSDASVFCSWLTDRQDGDWRYRLPTVDELRHHPHRQGAKPHLSKRLGYWARSGNAINCVQVTEFKAIAAKGLLVQRINKDLNKTRARARAQDLVGILDNSHVRALGQALNFDRTLEYTLARAYALNLASDSARDLILSLARDLTDDLSRTLSRARIRDLAQSLINARDLAHARGLAHDLVRGLVLTLAQVRDLARALSDAHARTKTSTFDLNLILALVQDSNLIRARDIARNLTRDLDRALGRILDRALDSDLIRARDIAATIARDLDHALDLARDSAYVLGLARDLDLTPDHDLSYTITLARDLAFARALARDRYRFHQDTSELPEDELCWSIRYHILMIIIALVEARQNPPKMRPKNNDKKEVQQKIQEVTNVYLALYIDLAILEERTQGNLPPFESIWLVKERKLKR